MKVQKINNGIQLTEAQSFKAIKLRKSALKMPEGLTKDTFELRSKLPDNAESKDLKYFGNSNIGGQGSNEMDDEDAVKFLIGWGAAIAAAALM